MKAVKCLDQNVLLEKGIDALYRELGPMEARRFIAMANPARREDSIKRHRRWQAGLNKDEFLARIRVAHEKSRKR
jgi:hypothetical protein